MALQQPTTGKTVQQFLAELDDLTKKNRGGFAAAAEDTGSSVPFIVPGRQIAQILPGATQQNTQKTFETPQDYQVPDYSSPYQNQGQEQTSNIQSFFEQLQQASQPDIVGQTPDGGVITGSGEVINQNGSITTSVGDTIYPIASLPNGNSLYSDGSVRKGGLEQLIQDIFGQSRPITQSYGNVNPMEPTPGNVNYGTDIRTRDLQGGSYGLPTESKIVQILVDDGIKDPYQSQTQGYGNSILVQLPSGEMLRFSHLESLPNAQVGDVIPAGTKFVTPGNTGNTNGPHLDLEYYNPQGQISDPQNYIGQVANNTTSPASVVPNSELTPEIQQYVNSYTGKNQFKSPIERQQGQVLGMTSQPEQNYTPYKPQGQVLGANTSRQATADALSGVGTLVNAPELKTNELVAEQGTNPIRQLAGNITDYIGTKLGLGENNISESITGGRTTNTLPQAGQGVQSLISDIKNASIFGPNTQLFTKPSTLDIQGPGRAVGSATANTLLPTGTVGESAKPANDTRDPFFRYGESENYSQFLDPNASQSGTLSTGIFSNDFYSDPNNVSSVFGGTHLAGQATDIFKEQFKDKYSDPKYDQADVESILNSIGTLDGTYTPNIREPRLSPPPSEGPSVKPTDINPQTGRAYAVNPNTGVWDDNYFSSSFSGGRAPTIEQNQQQGQTSGQGTQALVQESGRVVQAPQGTSLRTDSSGGTQAVKQVNPTLPSGRQSELSTPEKSTSAQVNKPAGSYGLFSSISNLFKRFFN